MSLGKEEIILYYCLPSAGYVCRAPVSPPNCKETYVTGFGQTPTDPRCCDNKTLRTDVACLM